MIWRVAGQSEIILPVLPRERYERAATPGDQARLVRRGAPERGSRSTERRRTGAGMGRSRSLLGASVAAMLALAATSCLSSDSGGGSGGGGGTKSGDKNVEIVFAFGGDQSKGFQQSLKDFQASSGIKIKFTEAAQSFDTLIRTRVRANNLPDIALFPQPGILKDFVKQGKMTDLSTQVDLEKLKSDLIPGVLDAGKVGDKYYGVPISMNVKSLVFYPKKAFQAKGYAIPKTQKELLDLTNKIKADGTTPWCVGMESSAATGWVATDWIEANLLEQAGPETYDKWVNHEIPFNDPAVKKAAQAFETLTLADGNVFGGRKQVVSTAFSTAANPMFNNPPRCFLHRQGNFITQGDFLPKPVRADLDNVLGVFQYPGETPESAPVLGGGDLAAVFNGKDDDTKQVMEYMTGASYPGYKEEQSFLSPRKDYPAAKYTTDVGRQIAKIAQDATVFRFDGSDQMPGAVGAGSFWKGMVAWVSGQKDLDTVLDEIEKSWPS
jgi:alpha-glucoside transport system substrate-binding protein